MIKRNYITQNYDTFEVEVEFLVIHYSATSLKGLFQIFADNRSKVSAHFAISEEGEIYEMVPCLNNYVCRAWHVGRSVWEDGKQWDTFNDISIGVELINLNGNVFKYTDQQINAVKWLIDFLKQKFPALRDPRRILGHEQISGYRGKVDPGVMFNWDNIFRSCYIDFQIPERKSVLPVSVADSLTKYLQESRLVESKDDRFWQKLNIYIEYSLRDLSDNSGEITWTFTGN